MAKSKMSMNSREVRENMDKLMNRLPAACEMFALTAAKQLESYAKQNRPWTDRTGRARQGLTGSAGQTQNGAQVVLAHTVDYGVWLELAHEKNYAIVEPTVRLKANEVMTAFANMVDSIKV